MIHEEDTFFGCEVDHIISEKHGGPTDSENLAFACVFCNRTKGSDIGSIIQPAGHFVRFYNPRSDFWAEHFFIEGTTIVGLSDIGSATARILEFNNNARLIERQALQDIGRYPSRAALSLLQKRR